MQDRNSFLLFGGYRTTDDPTVEEPLPLHEYNLITRTWRRLVTTTGPVNRQLFTATLVDGLVYIFGGTSVSPINRTVYSDLWSYDTATNTYTLIDAPFPTEFGLFGHTASSISPDTIMLLGGLSTIDPDAEPGTSVYVYNIRLAAWSRIFSAGTPPEASVRATAYHDPSTQHVYYFGGDNNAEPITSRRFSDRLHIFDISTMLWSLPDVSGPQPKRRSGAVSAAINNSTLLICYGAAGSLYFNSIDALLLPKSQDQIPTWATTIQVEREAPDMGPGSTASSSISPGATAGIVVGSVLGGILVLYLAYYCCKRRRFTSFPFGYTEVQCSWLYIRELLWSRRVGEPMWAEVTRLGSKMLLFAIFVVFFVILTIQILSSPKAMFTITVKSPGGSVPVPDIRFCFEGFSIQADPGTDMYPAVICMTDTGKWCNDDLHRLDMSIHAPIFMNNLGNTTCYLFAPAENAMSLGPATLSSSDTIFSGSRMQFNFQAANISEEGRIHVSFHHPQVDPNRRIYFDESPPKLTDEMYSSFIVDDLTDFHSSGSIMDLDAFDSSIVDYQFETTQVLQDVGWNYVGFAAIHDESYRVTTDSRIQSRQVPGSARSNIVGEMTVQPASDGVLLHREQKIHTLMNTVGIIGGLFGLFVTIQAILFGYRPQSPFGVVHRWIPGSSIDRGLKKRFDMNQARVPFVNPVHSRYESLDLTAYGLSKSYYVDEEVAMDKESREGMLSRVSLTGSDSTSTTQALSDERRLAALEDRVQLQELLLKSYYVDDEVFQRLDLAIRRPAHRSHFARRRGSAADRKEQIRYMAPENDMSAPEESPVEEKQK
ncbi:hypothetical protein BJV82DRAFT_634261 [Fennellomyces sp. T-0311]|nr:hypothetical protein BJV82DRAFT_634261 [Fennellomyces sp. T-0311]